MMGRAGEYAPKADLFLVGGSLNTGYQKIYKTQNFVDFTELTQPDGGAYTTRQILAIQPGDAVNEFFVTTNLSGNPSRALYYTDDLGQSFSAKTNPSSAGPADIMLYMPSLNRLLSGVSSGANSLFRSEDNGDSWTTMSISPGLCNRFAHLTDTDIVAWKTASTSYYYQSTNGGTSWSQISTSAGSGLLDVYYLPGAVVGSGKPVIHVSTAGAISAYANGALASGVTASPSNMSSFRGVLIDNGIMYYFGIHSTSGKVALWTATDPAGSGWTLVSDNIFGLTTESVTTLGANRWGASAGPNLAALYGVVDGVGGFFVSDRNNLQVWHWKPHGLTNVSLPAVCAALL
jgi:hypothetical protein